ncbi:hypothetical protein HispidOSU_004493, partial [Sigmodon hispidus]
FLAPDSLLSDANSKGSKGSDHVRSVARFSAEIELHIPGIGEATNLRSVLSLRIRSSLS